MPSAATYSTDWGWMTLFEPFSSQIMPYWASSH